QNLARQRHVGQFSRVQIALLNNLHLHQIWPLPFLRFPLLGHRWNLASDKIIVCTPIHNTTSAHCATTFTRTRPDPTRANSANPFQSSPLLTSPLAWTRHQRHSIGSIARHPFTDCLMHQAAQGPSLLNLPACTASTAIRFLSYLPTLLSFTRLTHPISRPQGQFPFVLMGSFTTVCPPVFLQAVP
ncbi:hypothetical protein CPC08DRAFT_704625, partial [Agrocybe pediades]